jgi:hypothetical protein
VRRKLHVGQAFLLSGLISLTCCSYGQREADSKSVRLNPNPNETIDVSGVVAAPLRVERLRVIYRTHSSLPFCNGVTFPDGGPFPRHLSIDVPTVNAGGRITAEIQADRYSGICGWSLSDIYAVVRDGGRDSAQDLVGKALPRFLAAAQRNGARGDLTTAYCGYKHTDFSCTDGPVGDDSYLPVIADPKHRHLRFEIRLGGYPPPPGYRAPCRDPEFGTPYYPCPAHTG